MRVRIESPDRGVPVAALTTAARADASACSRWGTSTSPSSSRPRGNHASSSSSAQATIQVDPQRVTGQFLDIHGSGGTAASGACSRWRFDPNSPRTGSSTCTSPTTAQPARCRGQTMSMIPVTSNPNVVDPSTAGASHVGSGNLGEQSQRRTVQYRQGRAPVRLGRRCRHSSNAQSLHPPARVFASIPGATLRAHGTREPIRGPLAVPEIWSCGTEDPFRFSFRLRTGDLVIATSETALGKNRFAPRRLRARPRPISAGELRGIRRERLRDHLHEPRFRLSGFQSRRRPAYGSRDHRWLRLRGTQIPSSPGRTSTRTRGRGIALDPSSALQWQPATVRRARRRPRGPELIRRGRPRAHVTSGSE